MRAALSMYRFKEHKVVTTYGDDRRTTARVAF